MWRIHLPLVGLDKYFSVIILLIILTSSCQKECAVIKNNSYKGYGIFYFENYFQDSRTELRFIPVCTEKDDLLHFRNLNPQIGFDVYCLFDDSFLRNVAMHSKTIPDKQSGYEYYLTPVYIEFEEALDYQERLKKSDVNQGYTKYDIPLTNNDTLMVKYFFSGADLSQIIKINRVDFLSFVEE
jgi:hypothetical protein